MSEKLLLSLLKESVDKCYLYDKTLINRSMEQASVARIFYYMQELLNYDTRFALLARYNLDNEYNKNGRTPKRTPRFSNGTRPDIVLHNRLDEPRQDNLLILEFKPAIRSRKSFIPKRDKEKLEDFTDVECGYNYLLGVFIRLNEKCADYKYFRNGCELSEEELRDD